MVEILKLISERVNYNSSLKSIKTTPADWCIGSKWNFSWIWNIYCLFSSIKSLKPLTPSLLLSSRCFLTGLSVNWRSASPSGTDCWPGNWRSTRWKPLKTTRDQQLPLQAVALITALSSSLFHRLSGGLQAALGDGDPRDLLEALLKGQTGSGRGQRSHGSTEEGITDDHVLMTAAEAFGAGVETTSTTLLWILAYLLHHPEVRGQNQHFCGLVFVPPIRAWRESDVSADVTNMFCSP